MSNEICALHFLELLRLGKPAPLDPSLLHSAIRIQCSYLSYMLPSAVIELPPCTSLRHLLIPKLVVPIFIDCIRLAGALLCQFHQVVDRPPITIRRTEGSAAPKPVLDQICIMIRHTGGPASPSGHSWVASHAASTYFPLMERALERYWGMACLKALMRPVSYSLGTCSAGASLALGSFACTQQAQAVMTMLKAKCQHSPSLSHSLCTRVFLCGYACSSCLLNVMTRAIWLQ